jgi:hypothetical protein
MVRQKIKVTVKFEEVSEAVSASAAGQRPIFVGSVGPGFWYGTSDIVEQTIGTRAQVGKEGRHCGVRWSKRIKLMITGSVGLTENNARWKEAN